jgi:L-methionine (R)-S-oxide reductase
MFSISQEQHASKAAQYDDLLQQTRALIADETDFIANAANFSSLVFHSLPELNWAGFYFFDGTELVVGPFQGKPACVRIALGRGVCGTAAEQLRTQVVPDVHAFPGHIACDSASRSEIVVPLVANDGKLIGVWDVDSPVANRFNDEDAAGMEALCTAFVALAWGKRAGA